MVMYVEQWTLHRFVKRSRKYYAFSVHRAELKREVNPCVMVTLFTRRDMEVSVT